MMRVSLFVRDHVLVFSGLGCIDSGMHMDVTT